MNEKQFNKIIENIKQKINSDGELHMDKHETETLIEWLKVAEDKVKKLEILQLGWDTIMREKNENK